MAKKWIEANDLSSGDNSINKNTRFKTSMWRWDLCDCSYAHIAVNGKIDILAATANENDKA